MARPWLGDAASLARFAQMALVGSALAGCVLAGCGGRSSDAALMSGQRDVSGDHDDGASISPALIGEEFPLGNDEAETARGSTGVAARLSARSIPLEWSQGGVGPSIFVEKSPLGTTFELVETSGRICVRGVVIPVPSGDYPNYWGGEVGVGLVSNLTEPGPPAEALSALGFAFRLEGKLPALLRFRVGAAGEIPLFSQYCQHVPLDTGSRIEVALAELTYECWNGGGQPFPDAAGATLLSWQVPANESSAGEFDFCIEDIQALLPSSPR
jgi:hypothetical protein